MNMPGMKNMENAGKMGLPTGKAGKFNWDNFKQSMKQNMRNAVKKKECWEIGTTRSQRRRSSREIEI